MKTCISLAEHPRMQGTVVQLLLEVTHIVGVRWVLNFGAKNGVAFVFGRALGRYAGLLWFLHCS